MDRPGRAPWNPDRTWADPLILTLLLLLAVVSAAGTRGRSRAAAKPAERVQLQGMLADAALASPRVLSTWTALAAPQGRGVEAFVDRDLQGWDRAVLAVHAGERGELDLAADLAGAAPGEVGDLFRAHLAWAYRGQGTPLSRIDAARVRRALGEGYAGWILEARAAARAGGDPAPLEAKAAAWAAPRALGLVAAGLGMGLLFLAGLAFIAFLALFRARPSPHPRFGMSGRALVIVLLAWFATHLLTGQVINLLLLPLPFLRPLFLPLSYGAHAALGLAYLCWAEDLTPADLARRLAPGRHGRALLSGLGFLALAFTAVAAANIALAPVMPHGQPPQKELMEMLARTRGPLAVAMTFLTVAVAAPVFEEVLFRGFLLPWLGERLAARMGPRAGWHLAVVVSGLAFGAMHMQPLGMPTLGTLGIVLGMAYLRTGNLLTSILVHGLWNGGIFLAMRLLV
ncbi:CPBP family intramembrane glutamic endopeptidase [Mesoterricola sediminis]|uniref:CAAX prenyl protease 2/Lysostaphin resistance protein A-like domain-containing protein n=1 Tax=Mesoterricola sediminis TaxID=2927980 RepID=A0AA48HIA8_9BACT|nr:CPBP family intramembrane glutamic endopeptidase [Mesoterricola sediminis]BDU78723.1 hypothetical protein METESE_36810 [Mesoterricola sediminis]